MRSEDPFARRHILLAAAEIIQERGSRGFQLEDVAEKSNIDIETITNVFDSRTQLIAEVQMANYFTMVEPIQLGLSSIEAAVASGIEADFWAGTEENLVMSWTSGQITEKWGIINLLYDIWSDPFTQSHFSELLDIQFQRWIAVIDGAKTHGWIDEAINASALTAVFWSASVGQVITAGSTSLDLAPATIRDFFVTLVRKRNQPEASRA